MKTRAAQGFETRAIHAGQEPEPSTGAVIPPIYQTSTYVQDGVGRHRGFEYSRTDNPTRRALERQLASLEGATQCVAFASGMAAASTIGYLCRPGDRVVCGDDVYGGTYRFLVNVLAPYGVEIVFADLADPAAVAAAARSAAWVWVETPTNPLLKIIDLRALAQAARASGARVVVDNTFASPYLQRPIEHGADVALHSATKYLGGHSDTVLGALVTSDAGLAEQFRYLQNAVGAVPGPFDCFLVTRGMKTLALRMERHCANALAVARMLAAHPRVARVHYPGLPEHPGHELASRQMSGPGGMVSFELKGGAAEAVRVAEATSLFSLAESLGGIESLIEVPAAMTHLSAAGSPVEVPAGLVRLSVGLESTADLVGDLESALG